MARNGTGQYVAPNSSWNPSIGGVLATASDWQSLLNDLSAALTQSVSRDGQSPMLGNLNLANNKITNLAAGTGSGDAATWAQLFGASTQADIASAATTDIGQQNTSFLRVTGTTTITSFGTSYRGPRFLTFADAVTLTNSSTLVLPGNANITTAAGDSLIVIPGATLGTADKWIVVAYQSATVAPSVGGFSFRNRLMNAQGLINQRGYASGTATTTANQYTLDRWRVVTSGQNLTFSTSANQVTFTAPAGGVEQVIEGLNLESGTYVLNWEGTATATVGGAAVAKGGTVTVVGGTNTTVRFIGGTFIRPQFEAGSVATPFERRPYGTELALCQRYFEIFTRVAYNYAAGGTGAVDNLLRFAVTKRAVPTCTKIGTWALVTISSQPVIGVAISLEQVPVASFGVSGNCSYDSGVVSTGAVTASSEL
jgi:hypothetical protein